MKRVLFPLILLLALACNRDEAARSATPSPAPPAGNAERGRVLAGQFGCNVCHIVPGVEGAQGSLGPSLAGIASRPAISFNTVRNTPENLAKFIQEPASLNPQSSMPPVGVSESDAKDIAAFLLTLK